MAKHVLSVICKNIIVDEQSKMPSFIGVLTGATYNVSKIPGPIPPFHIVSIFHSDSLKAEKITLRIDLITPSQNKKNIIEAPIEVGGRYSKNTNINAEIGNLTAEEEGEHIIVVSFKKGKKEQEVAELSFNVSLIKAVKPEPKMETKKK